MRAIIETVFDIFYLVTVLTVGIRMIRGSKAGTQFRLFGLMAVVLGAGDSFHLVPRALALCTTGLENYAVPLGLGKWITSVTMTVFYVLLYYVWRKRYQIEGQKNVTAAVYALSAVRIVLCMMPQNQWLTNHTPLAWGILRNVPFALLGLLIIVLFYRSAKQNNDKAFRWMWLTIVLSFGFYTPVVLWADVNPLIGMLMIQDLRLRLDRAHRLQRHEGRNRQAELSLHLPRCLGVYLKSRKFSLFLQAQLDFALNSLEIHKGFLRLFALNPACVCEIFVIFFVFRYTLTQRGAQDPAKDRSCIKP